MKRSLFVFRAPPFESSCFQEGLDALMALAAFEQPADALLMGESLQVLSRPENFEQPPAVLKRFASIPLFGIETVLVSRKELADKNLDPDNFSLDVRLLDDEELVETLTRYDHLFSF